MTARERAAGPRHRAALRGQHAATAGRVLLAVPFIVGSGQALRDPGPLPAQVGDRGLPRPELLVRATAGAMLIGAVALGTGTAPLAGAGLLAGVLVGTTVVVHGFWNDAPGPARTAHQRAFVANCGLLGGLLPRGRTQLVAVNPPSTTRISPVVNGWATASV